MITVILQTIIRAVKGQQPLENELLARIATGDESALEELYHSYNRILFRIVRSMVKNQVEAEDILQDVFNQIWLKAYLFDAARGSGYTWIISICRNKALDFIRSKANRQRQLTDSDADSEFSFLDQIESDSESPLQSTILEERSAILRQALANIPVDQQEVLRIAYFDGYSQSEIAENLSLPIGTVKSRMRQGMIKLEAFLRQKLGDTWQE